MGNCTSCVGQQKVGQAGRRGAQSVGAPNGASAEDTESARADVENILATLGVLSSESASVPTTEKDGNLEGYELHGGEHPAASKLCDAFPTEDGYETAVTVHVSNASPRCWKLDTSEASDVEEQGPEPFEICAKGARADVEERDEPFVHVKLHYEESTDSAVDRYARAELSVAAPVDAGADNLDLSAHASKDFLGVAIDDGEDGTLCDEVAVIDTGNPVVGVEEHPMCNVSDDIMAADDTLGRQSSYGSQESNEAASVPIDEYNAEGERTTWSNSDESEAACGADDGELAVSAGAGGGGSSACSTSSCALRENKIPGEGGMNTDMESVSLATMEVACLVEEAGAEEEGADVGQQTACNESSSKSDSEPSSMVSNAPAEWEDNDMNNILKSIEEQVVTFDGTEASATCVAATSNASSDIEVGEEAPQGEKGAPEVSHYPGVEPVMEQREAELEVLLQTENLESGGDTCLDCSFGSPSSCQRGASDKDSGGEKQDLTGLSSAEQNEDTLESSLGGTDVPGDVRLSSSCGLNTANLKSASAEWNTVDVDTFLKSVEDEASSFDTAYWVAVGTNVAFESSSAQVSDDPDAFVEAASAETELGEKVPQAETAADGADEKEEEIITDETPQRGVDVGCSTGQKSHSCNEGLSVQANTSHAADAFAEAGSPEFELGEEIPETEGAANDAEDSDKERRIDETTERGMDVECCDQGSHSCNDGLFVQVSTYNAADTYVPSLTPESELEEKVSKAEGYAHSVENHEGWNTPERELGAVCCDQKSHSCNDGLLVQVSMGDADSSVEAASPGIGLGEKVLESEAVIDNTKETGDECSINDATKGGVDVGYCGQGSHSCSEGLSVQASMGVVDAFVEAAPAETELEEEVPETEGAVDNAKGTEENVYDIIEDSVDVEYCDQKIHSCSEGLSMQASKTHAADTFVEAASPEAELRVKAPETETAAYSATEKHEEWSIKETVEESVDVGYCDQRSPSCSEGLPVQTSMDDAEAASAESDLGEKIPETETVIVHTKGTEEMGEDTIEISERCVEDGDCGQRSPPCSEGLSVQASMDDADAFVEAASAESELGEDIPETETVIDHTKGTEEKGEDTIETSERGGDVGSCNQRSPPCSEGLSVQASMDDTNAFVEAVSAESELGDQVPETEEAAEDAKENEEWSVYNTFEESLDIGCCGRSCSEIELEDKDGIDEEKDDWPDEQWSFGGRSTATVSRHMCMGDFDSIDASEDGIFSHPLCLSSTSIQVDCRRHSENGSTGSGGALSDQSNSAELHLLVSADIEAECEGGRSIAADQDIRRWKELLQAQLTPKLPTRESVEMDDSFQQQADGQLRVQLPGDALDSNPLWEGDGEGGGALREEFKALVDQLDAAAVARLIVWSQDCALPRSPDGESSRSDVMQLQRYVDELLAKVAQLEYENLAFREETRKHTCARCGYCFEPPSAEAHLSPAKSDRHAQNESGSFCAYPKHWSSFSWMGQDESGVHTPNAPTAPTLSVLLIVNADPLERPVNLVVQLNSQTPSPQPCVPPSSADRSPRLALRARAAIRLARECMARSPRPTVSPPAVQKPWAVEMGHTSPGRIPYHADVQASCSF